MALGILGSAQHWQLKVNQAVLRNPLPLQSGLSEDLWGPPHEVTGSWGRDKPTLYVRVPRKNIELWAETEQWVFLSSPNIYQLTYE